MQPSIIMPSITLRQRFDRLRKAMSWSWADIDRITGRKFTSTNISKGVPNWARLAIEAHESYQNLIQLHLLDAVRLRLGYEWAFVQRKPGEFTFVPPHPIGDSIMLSFSLGHFHLTGNSAHLPGLADDLLHLYPSRKPPKRVDGIHHVTFLIQPTSDQTASFAPYLREHAVPT